MLNLKDGLKDIITVGLQTYKSINEVLIADYERYKAKGEGYDIAKYRGIIITLGIQGENEPKNKEYDDFYENESLYSNIKTQIDRINRMMDGE